MPGRSSTTKEEPAKAGPPPSLLGAAGGIQGGAGQDDCVVDPAKESQTVSPATVTIAEGAHRWEKYSLLVRIFTARQRRSLEPHAWVEDLLKDFFQSILGINLSVILLSPTECLIFCGNRTQGQGMSWCTVSLMRAALIYISEYVETKRMMTEGRYNNEDLLIRLRAVFGHVDQVRNHIDRALQQDDAHRRKRDIQFLILPTHFPRPESIG